MTDFDQTIFDNPKLGSVGTCDFLDEVQAQVLENSAARAEDRSPRVVVPRERFGNYRGLVTNGPLKFEDGTPAFDACDMNDYWQNWENQRVDTGQAPADMDHDPED